MLSEQEKQNTEDFYMFQDQERPYFHKFDNRVLSAKAGSLFLWDSRLAHQNVLPGKNVGQVSMHACYFHTYACST